MNAQNDEPVTVQKERREIGKLTDIPDNLRMPKMFHGKKKFQLKADITKTHFKELMGLLQNYDSKTKTGEVRKENIDKLKNLIDKMELSNANIAAKSHAKSIETSKTRRIEKNYEEPDMPTQREDGSWYDAETGFDIPTRNYSGIKDWG